LAVSRRRAAEPASARSPTAAAAAAAAVPLEGVDGAQKHHAVPQWPDADLLLQHFVIEGEEDIAIDEVVQEFLAVLSETDRIDPCAYITDCNANNACCWC
jgi:hypothetical protein